MRTIVICNIQILVTNIFYSSRLDPLMGTVSAALCKIIISLFWTIIARHSFCTSNNGT